MNRILPALVLGFFVALAGTCFYLSPAGQKIEEDLGLFLLFKMRGPRTPPDSVAIVNLDDRSSAGTNRSTVAENFSKWPRSVHAEIVKTLKSWGVSVIAFDVHFVEHKDKAGDTAFARSLKEAGNVILFAGLNRETFNAGTPAEVIQENLVSPIPSFAESAMAVAPFPLPKVPVRLNQTWTFKAASGGEPTLPVVALQASEIDQYERLHKLIREKIPGSLNSLPSSHEEALASLKLIEIMQYLHSLFLQEKRLSRDLLTELTGDSQPDLTPEEKRTLMQLIGLYSGSNSRYLNYYGPPRTLKTYSYNQILSSDGKAKKKIAGDLQGKVVFIGASPNSSFGQKDGFYTVFSQPDGLDISGVELAGTVFANLYENMFIQPLSRNKGMIIAACCGIGAVLASVFLSPLQAAALITAASLGLFLSASYVFGGRGIWMPVIIPFALQPLVAFFSVLYWKFYTAHREKENMNKALGFYLPDRVVKELTKDPGFIKTGDRMVYSICLQTDAQHYTSLSEKTEPRSLGNLMREYYHHIFEPVQKNGGVVSDVVGDAMLALWPSAQPLIDLRRSACKAALEILEAADKFNRKFHTMELPTRIGLHYGYMLLGNIGAGRHYEYTPVGDIVNTTSRIEKLNKTLNTKILASQETVQDLPEIITREIGTFLLSGKSDPVIIHELLAIQENIDHRLQKLCELFGQALSLFKGGEWDPAIHCFNQCIEMVATDGPSLFYLQLCKLYRNNPPQGNWQGIIRIDTK